MVPAPDVLYWRTSAGEEVDFVIETEDRLLPIEVKATARPTRADVRHLRSLLEEYRGAAQHGILLHTGARCERLAEAIWAVPLTAVLDAP